MRRPLQNMGSLKIAVELELGEAIERPRPPSHYRALHLTPGLTSINQPPGKTSTLLLTGALFFLFNLCSLIDPHLPLSDSDDDEVKKTNKWKGITIKPVTAGPSANSSASVDELQRVVGGLDISATLPVRKILFINNSKKVK